MKRKNKKNGFSLIEVVVVLAISAGLLVMVAGVYAQRRRVASEDAVKQIASSIETVRNEAQKGLGPVTPDGTAKIQTGTGNTIFGEAIEFRNDCSGSNSCLRVYKLMNAGGSIVPYETYDIAVPDSYIFNASQLNDCPGAEFVSCYSQPGRSLDGLSDPPVNISSLAPNMMIVIRNGSGDMYAFSKDNTGNVGPDANKLSEYRPNRRGTLRVAASNPDRVEFYLTISLSGDNSIKVERR